MNDKDIDWDFLSFGELNLFLAKILGQGSIEGLKPVYSHDGRFIGIVGEGLSDAKNIIRIAFEEVGMHG